jgi:hypothetical protein
MLQSSSVVDKAVERILELSADLHIKRRATTKYSLAYHDMSVAIATYGDALKVLRSLQEEERYSSALGLLSLLETSAEPLAVL